MPPKDGYDPARCRHCHVCPHVPDRSLCAPCAAAHREREAKRRERARRGQRCVVCEAPAATDRRYCGVHLEYYRARTATAAAAARR